MTIYIAGRDVTRLAIRNSGVLHRNAIALADKLPDPTTAVTPTGVTISGGGLVSGTGYRFAWAAYNRWGVTLTNTVSGSTTPGGSNNAHRSTFAQVAGADGYDLFLANATNPLHVLRITEAQRASGIQCTVAETPAAGSIANNVDIGAVGTGTVANNANPFANNNAYCPDGSGPNGAITPINCAGYSKARIKVKFAAAHLGTLPTLNLMPFFGNQVSPTDFHPGSLITVPLLTNVGQPQEQELSLDVAGEPSLVVLIDTITGSTPTCSIWVELI